MKSKRFDRDLIAALDTLGFKIEDDEEEATATDVRLQVLWPVDKSTLLLTIELPNGSSLVCHVEPAKVIARAEQWT
jgi:hypothetical protein